MHKKGLELTTKTSEEMMDIITLMDGAVEHDAHRETKEGWRWNMIVLISGANLMVIYEK